MKKAIPGIARPRRPRGNFLADFGALCRDRRRASLPLLLGVLLFLLQPLSAQSFCAPHNAGLEPAHSSHSHAAHTHESGADDTAHSHDAHSHASAATTHAPAPDMCCSQQPSPQDAVLGAVAPASNSGSPKAAFGEIFPALATSVFRFYTVTGRFGRAGPSPPLSRPVSPFHPALAGRAPPVSL